MGQATRRLANPLDRYFSEIRRHPPLTLVDEKRISRKIRQGQRDAIHELVTPNLPFVAKIARDYVGRGPSYEDLLSEGALGLMDAAERYDGDRDIRFVVYAAWWIRKYMLAALARHPVVIAPKPRPSRRKEGEPLPYVRQFSLEAGEDEGRLPLSEVLSDPDAEDVETVLIEEQSHHQIGDAVRRLPETERFIVRRRFGLDGRPAGTLREVGSALGLTRERVRQIECRAKERLRRILAARQAPARWRAETVRPLHRRGA